MNILISGGTGLIGRALCRSLELHHSLIVLTRSPYEVGPLMSPYVELASDIERVDFNLVDIVINLAGEPIAEKRWSRAQKKAIEHSRWSLTEAIVRKIQHADTPPSLLISGSAVGYYGRQTALNISEDFAQVSPEFSHNLCRRWEQIALSACSEDTRVVTLRTGIVLSDKGGALAKMLPAFRLGLGGPIASGEQHMSWIHIDDMVRLVEFVIKNKGVTGAVNAVAPNPVCNRDFSLALAKSISRPCKLSMPAFVTRLLFGEVSDLLTTGQHVIPAKLQAANFQFNYENLPDALAAVIKVMDLKDRHYEKQPST